jgi:peptidoglycan/xylan/chitin deacetylase (PgdA/CDA1 family)
MKTNSISLAAEAKGTLALFKRACSIANRYGLTPAKMDRSLHRFAEILRQFDCGATFPLTAVALKRNGDTIARYLNQNIEFAIHGHTHIDYSQLAPDEQLDHLRCAREAFASAAVEAVGFRCPYLRWSAGTLAALEQQGLVYDSSQALAWDVLDGTETESYRRVLDFYGAHPASEYLSLPQVIGGLVRIPYSLPDDEALVDRLQLTDTQLMAGIWSAILRCTYELGELFTVGLHPERIALCEEALRAVLTEARSLSPRVWIARLDEIADWWRRRAATTYQVTKLAASTFRLTVDGPPGMTVLSRGVEVEAPTEPWSGDYQRVLGNELTFQSEQLPFVGVSPGSSPALARFLQQQGYLIVRDGDAAFYLEHKDFDLADERALLRRIEEGAWPLLRLARWPDGARSALSITGDIDALTLWDYALRVFSG